MRVMDVLKRIKAGDAVMVTMPTGQQTKTTYSLKDGTSVSDSQFHTIKEFLRPCDPPLIEGMEPTSYVWAS